MRKIDSKQIIPICMAAFALTFGLIGVLQLGFWDQTSGPMPGFFPSIMAVVMFVTSILAFVQSFKETEKAKYNKMELLVISAAAGIILATFVVGLVLSCFIFVLLWLRLLEKAPWKDVIIIMAVIGVIVIGVFGIWLGIQFPMGLLEYVF